MFTLGSLAFLSPWFLAPLAGLPLLWWLLRITPPPPRQIIFPAVRLLAQLRSEEETPARTPWWLLLLRILAVALFLLAFAHPILDPNLRLGPGNGPVILVIDDGWAAGPDWRMRREAAEELVAEAARENRSIRLLTTAPPADGASPQVSGLLAPAEALTIVRALQPKPWPVDRGAALTAIASLEITPGTGVFWLANGLDGVKPNPETFSQALQRLGPLDVLSTEAAATAVVLEPADDTGGNMALRARRAGAGPAVEAWVLALTKDNRIVARESLAFAAGAKDAQVSFDFPTATRNRIARFEIENAASAGAVVLTDERWRRRPVGLVSGQALESEQPLLSAAYFLERALGATTELRRGEISGLLARPLAVMMLADVGRLNAEEKAKLETWTDGGGVLVRFAGPRLAKGTDDLVPVRLRAGDRHLAGAMTWSQPAKLMPFPEHSPFHGLKVPGDVRVNRQVLAEPSANLGDHTWARLEDGTPIVTAEKRGRGWIVLVHTTANTDWSNLALSGLFVDMLHKLIDLAHGVGLAGSGEIAAALPAHEVLDGFGHLVPPTGSLSVLRDQTAPGPGLPPGYYGAGDNRRAFNLGPAVTELAALGRLAQGVRRFEFGGAGQRDLKPALLVAALALTLLDLAIALSLRGLLLPSGPRRRPPAAVGVLAALVLVLLLAGGALAQETDDEFALAASLDTRLAYVLTGDAELDRMSQAGLTGLTNVLEFRTSVEGAEPLGIDIEIDEISFFPLLYWPVSAGQSTLSTAALAKLSSFMKNGGTILFDTRDQQNAGLQSAAGSSTAEGNRLRRLLERLDVPPLTTVPAKHILTRAFYLMQDFPGRWAGGKVWVERHVGGINDGVSGVIIGSNDWASAWAIDDGGRALAAVVPGGERQREMAYRFGVNVVMYALTGNYKADQVHVPALLERLGQ